MTDLQLGSGSLKSTVEINGLVEGGGSKIIATPAPLWSALQVNSGAIDALFVLYSIFRIPGMKVV